VSPGLQFTADAGCCTGPLPIDKEVYSQLLATGQFEQMNLDVDEVRGMLGSLREMGCSCVELSRVGLAEECPVVQMQDVSLKLCYTVGRQG
jgi:hypothetical protein